MLKADGPVLQYPILTLSALGKPLEVALLGWVDGELAQSRGGALAELLHGIPGPFGGSGSCRRLPSPKKQQRQQQQSQWTRTDRKNLRLRA